MSAQWFFQGGQCRRLFPMLEGGAGLVFQRWKVMKPLIPARSVTRRGPRGIGGGKNRAGGGAGRRGGSLSESKGDRSANPRGFSSGSACQTVLVLKCTC